MALNEMQQMQGKHSQKNIAQTIVPITRNPQNEKRANA